MDGLLTFLLRLEVTHSFKAISVLCPAGSAV